MPATLSVDALFGSLPPETQLQLATQSAPVQQALAKGLSIVGDVTPAYNFIDKLASGGTPSPSDAVGALSGVAFAINPVAGAAFAAMGAGILAIDSGLQSLFTSLGLIDDAPKPVAYVGLIKKGLAVPTGPSDPLWWPWEKFAKVSFEGAGTDYVQFRPDSVLTGTQQNATNTPESAVAWTLLRAAANSDIDVHDAPNHWAIKGQGPQYALEYEFYPLNSFEKFFFELLKRDLEFWANGLPWVDPRQLLHKAADTWNAKHQPAPGAAFAYAANESTFRIIPLLLSSQGDITGGSARDTLAAINGGVTLVNPPRAQPGQAVTTVHVPATNAAPAVSYHVLTAVKPGASAQNVTFSTLFAKYKAQGMTDDQAIAAATAELQGKTGSPVQKVTVAQPLRPGLTTGGKVLLGLLVAASGGAIILGRKGKGR